MPSLHRKPLARCIALSTFWCAATLAPDVLAVGLGEVTLQSHLGKPLQARIPLTHLGDLSGDQIKVTLGSDEEYTRLGVDRDYLHSQIRMESVVEGGNAYVRLVTTQPIVEPYINLVVSLRWPTGQLAREYTMLLDIPTVAAPTASVSATPSSATSTSAPAAAAASSAGYASGYASAPATPQPVMDGRYRTARGDSLWRLAQRLRTADVSVEQMMAALYEANPDAFLNGDPARLKEAVELAVPDSAQVAAAGPLPESAPARTTAPATTPEADRFAGTSASTPESAAAPADAEPADTGGPRLELLAPSDVEQLSAENAALREEVKSLTSNVGALTGQLDRSEQRLAQVESQLQQVLAGYDRQRGVEGAAAAGTSPFADGALQPATAAPDDGGIAAAQPAPEREGSLWMHISYWVALGALGGWALYQQSRGRRVEEVEELEPVAPIKVSTPPSPPPRVLQRDAPRDTSSEFQRDTPREVIQKTTPRQSREAAASAAAAPAEPAAEWGSAEDNERYWHHHKESTAELPLDLLDDMPEPAPARAAVDGVEESVDASISAGVFLAFGRYSEAEQVLQEALQRDPSRQDLRLQLLDVYQQADMREAFDQLAKAIEIECDDQPGVLAEVAAMRDSYSGRF